MPSGTKELNREYQSRWWKKNKATQQKRVQAQKEAVRQWAIALKNSPCTDCGVSYPTYVMDWDHTRGIKDSNVSKLHNKGSKRRILREIAKCDLVCSNCHRIRTHKRYTAKKQACLE